MAYVNINGAGVTRHAPNSDNAVRFFEYLTGPSRRDSFAEGNNEYPVVGAATGPIGELVTFKEDAVNASGLGANQSLAVRVFDKAGWR